MEKERGACMVGAFPLWGCRRLSPLKRNDDAGAGPRSFSMEVEGGCRHPLGIDKVFIIILRIININVLNILFYMTD